jgi:F0F1-type ATP synthase epsilon subunit
MNCIIVSPTSIIYEWPVSLVSFKTVMWAVTVLPNHQPTAMILVEWKLKYEYLDNSAPWLEGYQTSTNQVYTEGWVCYIDQKNIQIILQ